MTCPSIVLKVFIVLFVLSYTVTAEYTVPGKVPIQGRLTNVSTGAALSGPYNFTFRVYNASTDGTKLWEENLSLTVDSGGLWSTFLGNNTPLALNFSEDTYIEIEINHDNDPLPRVQLATVPYSKRTDIAANLSCVDCIGGVEINESTLSGVNAAQLNGQSSGYYLNTSTPFGGDVSGAYGSLDVNASKIDIGILNRSYIEDAYLLNTGDNASGNYNFDSDTLYVDSSNHRIGIGTNTPTYKLEVQGGVNATGNLTTPLVCLNGDCRSTWPTGSGISSAGGWVNSSTETYSSLNLNLSNKFFFNASTGNVGIGTIVPSYNLHVKGGTGVTIEQTVNGNALNLELYNSGGQSYAGGLYFGANNNAGNQNEYAAIWGGIDSNATGAENGTLRFVTQTAGTRSEKMRIDSKGNVGIGTTNPAGLLHVKTTATMVPFTATGGTITYSGGYTIHTFTSGTASFSPNGAGNVEVLVVAGGGGGGGGTNGGHIGGGGGAGGMISNSSFAVAQQAYSITVGAGGAGSTGSFGTVGGTGGNSVFSTLTGLGGGGGGPTLSGNGGSGGSGGGGSRDNNNNLGGTGLQPGSASGGLGNDGGRGGVANPAGGGGGAGGVGQSTAAGGAGGVGVASSISGSLVTYATGGGGGSCITPSANTGNGGGGGFGDGCGSAPGGSGIVIIRYLTNSTIYVPAVDALVVNSSGNVGIGTTSPSYKLQLSTDSAAKPGTNTWTIASDERIKTSIHPFTDGLSVLDGINPVWYQYNGKADFTADGKDYVGVIAQDIEKVAPYTVSTYKTKLNANDTNETELMNFNSHALTFVLINSVKELDSKNREQQSEIGQLKAENGALMARIDNLSAKNGELKVENTAQQKEIDGVKALVCPDHPDAAVCRGISGI
jgi:hypothetical protein